VGAGSAVNKKAAKPSEYSVMPPNKKAVHKTAKVNIIALPPGSKKALR
jgi:hypothetical protein